MPKQIVLLSDGTGNSAAKAFKTNVWRVYQALDVRDPQVRAIYDDGVALPFWWKIFYEDNKGRATLHVARRTATTAAAASHGVPMNADP